jgi:hypothetical protein
MHYSLVFNLRNTKGRLLLRFKKYSYKSALILPFHVRRSKAGLKYPGLLFHKFLKATF